MIVEDDPRVATHKGATNAEANALDWMMQGMNFGGNNDANMAAL